VAAFHAEMAAFLHHWLIDHIIKSDLRMKPYAANIELHAGKLGVLGQPGETRGSLT
jgi:hemerythrin